MEATENTRVPASETWKYGLGVGSIAGVLDAILIAASAPGSPPWLLVQSAIAWTLTGWAVIATNSGLRPIAHGMLVSVLLNLAWYIQFAILPGQYTHLPPLVIMSLIFGAAFGWAKRRMQTRLPKSRMAPIES